MKFASKTRRRCAAATTLAMVIAFAASPALAESKRGPFFVQGHVAGISVGLGAQVSPNYPVEIDLGYHVAGTHEGFVVGLAQRFDIAFNGFSTGATAARLGWDIAIDLSGRELTIAPFAQGGVAYAFEGGDPAGFVGTGVEGRFFPIVVEEKHGEKKPKVRVSTKRVVVAADRIDIKEKIQFRANEAVIEAVSFPLLDEIASVIKQNTQIRKLRIEGHASSEGDAELNKTLSDQRAKAVRTYLVDKGGVSESTLDAEGFGSEKALADNDSEEGREKNRRVEFNIVEQDETVERVETKTETVSSADGFYVVVKPFEIDLAISSEVIPILSFQAGVGWAF